MVLLNRNDFLIYGRSRRVIIHIHMLKAEGRGSAVVRIGVLRTVAPGHMHRGDVGGSHVEYVTGEYGRFPFAHTGNRHMVQTQRRDVTIPPFIALGANADIAVTVCCTQANLVWAFQTNGNLIAPGGRRRAAA